MAVKKLKLEVTMHGIHIDKLESKVGDKTLHLYTAELIWPRGAIARKTSVQTYSLARGELKADALPWGERILFKEDVEGRFAFRLTLSKSKSLEEIEKFLHSMAGMFLTVGADLLGGYFPSPERRLAVAPLREFSKNVGAYSGPPDFVKGLIDINPQELSTTRENIIAIPLVTSSSLVETKRTMMSGKRKSFRKTILKKGEGNGVAKICIKVL